MGTKCIGPQIGEGESGRPFSPDGLLSLTSFTLKKVHDGLEMNSVPPVDTSLSVQTDMESECSTSDAMKLTRCLRRRPWINYGMFDFSSDEESDMENFSANGSPKPLLPKGVIRGCSNCNNCQKVIARWRPKDSCRPVINEAPVFYPSEEEFKDTLKYIASIRQMVEPYGICRIIPPSSWKPPCPLKGKHIWGNAKFITRIQQLDKLQNREPMRKNSRMAHTRKKRRRCLKAGMPCGHGDPDAAGVHDVISQNEHFGFLPGPEFSLESFEKYADDFVEQYFGLKDTNPSSDSGHEATCQHEPSVEDIEGEFWRMVEKPTEEIEVLYGADLETGAFGSGFPKALPGSGNSDSEEYVRSGWNLNNFPRLAGSVLSFEKSDISGVLVPWLYIGMCFSSFCWHVEDHHLYSLNYLHWGAPKLWYGVPGSHALKLEAAMKKHLPHLFEEQPDLLHKLVTQLSPTILKSEGVPVYRCVQQSGEFVLTFPRAYHSGFNCGFNCAEAVNVAPIDWLPHGQSAVELYAQQHRKTSLSHDKLLLGAAQDAIKALWEIHFLRKETPDNLRWDDACGKDGILTMALKTRIDIERARRQFFCCPSQVRKMDVNFDATNKRECIICFYDLHLSAAGCACSPETFACLNHAKQLCSCAWSTRIFLFRYELTELDICVEALGGKLSAIHRWANLYLGLSLSSHVTKNDSSQVADNRSTLVGNGLLGDMKTKEERPASEQNLVQNLLLESLPVCQLSEEDTSYTCENSSGQVRRSIFSPSISENKLSYTGSSKPRARKPGRTVNCLSDDDDNCQAEGSQLISNVKVEESTTEDMEVSERFVDTKNGSVGNESQGDPLSGIGRTNAPATNDGKPKLYPVLDKLTEPTRSVTGLTIDLEVLVHECRSLFQRIADIIFLDRDRVQTISSFPCIPDEFLVDMESLWTGRAKRIHAEDAFVGVKRVAAALSLTFTDDFYPIVLRVKAIMSPFGGPRGDYQKDIPSTFSLSPRFSIFPHFNFHLRRSQFVQVFNHSPHENAYFRLILNRENAANSVVMIQPSDVPTASALNYPSISVVNITGQIIVSETVKNVGTPGYHRVHVRLPAGFSVTVNSGSLKFVKDLDTLGALAVAMGPSTDELTRRAPVGRKDLLITNIMWRNIIVQVLNQATFLLVLKWKVCLYCRRSYQSVSRVYTLRTRWC